MATEKYFRHRLISLSVRVTEADEDKFLCFSAKKKFLAKRIYNRNRKNTTESYLKQKIYFHKTF